MLYEAIVVALVVFLTVGGQELLGFTMLGRPIVIGPLVGLLLGDIQTGLLIGASLETIFMGVVNIGGASSAEPGLATALAAAFAINLGGGVEVALFYFLGFLIVAYFKIPLIAVAVLGVIIAVTIGQRDFQLKKMEQQIQQKPTLAVTNETTEEIENDDFFS